MDKFVQNPVTQKFVSVFKEIKKAASIKSNAQFARKIEFSPQSLNEILMGRRDITIEFIRKCFTNLGLNPVHFFADSSEKLFFLDTEVAASDKKSSIKNSYKGQNETSHFAEEPKAKYVHPIVHPIVHPTAKSQNETSHFEGDSEKLDPKENVTTTNFSTNNELIKEIERLKYSNNIKDQTIAALQRAVEAYEMAGKWRELYEQLMKERDERKNSA